MKHRWRLCDWDTGFEWCMKTLRHVRYAVAHPALSDPQSQREIVQRRFLIAISTVHSSLLCALNPIDLALELFLLIMKIIQFAKDAYMRLKISVKPSMRLARALVM